MALALVEAKVLVTVCDPLGRIERHFMEYHYCHEDFDNAQLQMLVQRGRTQDGCFRSAAAIWEEREGGQMRHLWQTTATKQHLNSMLALFFGRILALHKDFLHKPEHTYSIVAEFLGARYKYPKGTSFGRFNVVGGHRTDLCRNGSLVRRLQKMLEPEYQAQILFLRRAGSPVPESLTQRVSRCKFADDHRHRCAGRETAC